jgi:hypothetical protein
MKPPGSHPEVAFVGAGFFFLVAFLLQVGRVRLWVVERLVGVEAVERWAVAGCLLLGILWTTVGASLVRNRRRAANAATHPGES